MGTVGRRPRLRRSLLKALIETTVSRPTSKNDHLRDELEGSHVRPQSYRSGTDNRLITRDGYCSFPSISPERMYAITNILVEA
jgi:hypothetical protein